MSEESASSKDTSYTKESISFPQSARGLANRSSASDRSVVTPERPGSPRLLDPLSPGAECMKEFQRRLQERKISGSKIN